MDKEIKMLADDELKESFIDDAFKMYLKEIRRYPNLTIEEQKDLGRRYKENNDLKAREVLINCNLSLVVNIAKRYKSRFNQLQILDVIQEGNFGLIRAVETYDPEQGAFTTYATPWIKQKITRGLANKNDEIRKPIHIVEATSKYIVLVKQYEQKGLPLPTDDVICNILNISMEFLQNIKDYFKQDNIVSLNQIMGDSKVNDLSDIVSAENGNYDNVLNKIVDDELLLVLKEVLPPLHYYVIYYRILCDEQKTLEEIAFSLNVTKERVRQIVVKTLKRLKPYMKEYSLIFIKTLNMIKQREGYKIKYLKRTPLTPNQIIKYMYLKDDLTDLERKLYELNLLGKYTYTSEEYASILGITIQELRQVLVTLKAKINKKFNDVKSFKIFQEQMIKKYGSSIYQIELNNDEISNYHSIQESNFSFKKESKF